MHLTRLGKVIKNATVLIFQLFSEVPCDTATTSSSELNWLSNRQHHLPWLLGFWCATTVNWWPIANKGSHLVWTEAPPAMKTCSNGGIQYLEKQLLMFVREAVSYSKYETIGGFHVVDLQSQNVIIVMEPVTVDWKARLPINLASNHHL